jgi:small subunit ribosomal protein S17
MNQKSEVVTDSAEPRGRRKTQVGVVVSTSMSKTIVVETVRQVMHRKYGKFVRRTSKYYAHDGKGECGVGDEVRIVETRPLSKTKRWKLEEIVKRAV